MKPDLLIGLGNPLMGDEGIGWHIAEHIRAHPRLPADAEVIHGGTDLLRLANRLEGRERVILVDAVAGTTGDLVAIRDCFEDFDWPQGNAHCLSALQAVELLRAVKPELRSVRFTLVGVGIASASVGPMLSPPLTAAIPEILDRVFDELLDTR